MTTGWKSAALAAAIVTPAWMAGPRTPAAEQQDVPARVVQTIISGGGRIGVSVRDVDDEDVKRAKLPAAAGVLVEEVQEDSPAQKAGLRKGDVIVEFDGERVRSTRQFTRLVQDTPVGRKVQAAVVRDGQRVPLTVEARDANGFRYFGDIERLEDLGKAWRIAPPAPPAPPAIPAVPRGFDFDDLLGRSSARLLGITVGDLTSQLAEYFGTKEGVLVTSVSDNSAAAKAGLKAGDVITSVNGSNVASPADLRRRIDRVEGEDFSLGIVRDRKPMTIKGKLEDRSRRRQTVRTII